MASEPEQDAGIDSDGNPVDEYGQVMGWCNSCGEEAPLDTECCEDGEVVDYD